MGDTQELAATARDPRGRAGSETPAAMARALKRPPLMLVLACLLFVAQLGVYFNFSEDDPGISFRYAWNLAHGHGLVYNPGERVEGFSNFGYVVALAGLFRFGLVRDRLSALLAIRIINTVGGLFCLALLRRLVLRDPRLGRRPAAVAPLLLAGAGGLVLATASGLETVTLTLLVLCAATSVLRLLEDGAPPPTERLLASVVLCILAIWRIDAPWLLVLLGMFVLAVRRGRLTRADLAIAAPVLAAFVAYTVFRIRYFGTLLPNTFYAKVQLDPSLAGGWSYIDSFLHAHGGWIAMVAVVALGVSVRSRLARLAAVLFLGQLVYVAAVQGDWMPGFRFFTPVLPFLAILAATAFERIVALAGHGRTLIVTALVVTATVVMLARTAHNYHALWQREPMSWLRHPTFDTDQLTPYSGVARWIEDNLTTDATIALQEGGLIPFLTGRRTFETFGLCTPALAHLRGVPRDRFGVRADLTDATSPATAWILGRRPDALFLLPYAPMNPPRELHGGAYRLVQVMPLNQFAAGLEWVRNSSYRCAIYVRCDSTAFVEREFLSAREVAPSRVIDSAAGGLAASSLADGVYRVERGDVRIEASFDPPVHLSKLSLAGAGSLSEPRGVEIVVRVSVEGVWRGVAHVEDQNVGFTLDGTFSDAVGPLRIELTPPPRASAACVEVRGKAPVAVERLRFGAR